MELNHETIWRGIDALAEKYADSVSNLALKAGMNSTCFNMSKRTRPDGTPRWPNTESLSKVLEATGASFEEFIVLCAGGGLNTVKSRITWKQYFKIIEDTMLSKDASDRKEGKLMLRDLREQLEKEIPGGP